MSSTVGHYVKDQDIEWKDSLTLSEWVIRMIASRKTETPEFKAALEFHGRDKFKAIWKSHCEKKQAARDAN